MSVCWRDTLSILKGQFEALANSNPGLHHLLIEYADDEREQGTGPGWFASMFSHDKNWTGKSKYSGWDCIGFEGLPGIEPSFRHPFENETFEDDSKRVLRDSSGEVQAVFVPQKLRNGYYGGGPTHEVEPFKSLARSAANVLCDAEDLSHHPFAADMVDIFRQPRGGIRHVFGDVPQAPKHFISRGWNAGILQFNHGVLADVPISEREPNSGSWLLLLHRLAWRKIKGSGLFAERIAWKDNIEIVLESLTLKRQHFPGDLGPAFQKISPESFYSALGSKDSPLDVNLASVLAIQLLLSEEGTGTAARTTSIERTIDYSHETWKNLVEPEIDTVQLDSIDVSNRPQVALLVATDVERNAVFRKLKPPAGSSRVLEVFHGNNTYYVGKLGLTEIVMCKCTAGISGRDSAQNVTTEIIQDWDAVAIIMVGISFGRDPNKQNIGDVLISSKVVPYEPQRVGKVVIHRGNETSSGIVLLNRFSNLRGWKFNRPDGNPVEYRVGAILSGEKLVDDPQFKASLFKEYPEAIGGEMEGAGIASAAERNRREWIVVKSICDWGDGTKVDDHQDFAAASSVDLAEHVLNQPGVLDAILRTKPEGENGESSSLNEFQIDYLLEISKPRNDGKLNSEAIHGDGRSQARYWEALELFEQCDLMRRDGFIYSLTTKGWAAVDLIWEMKILNTLEQGRLFEVDAVIESVGLTDGEVERELFLRFLRELESNGFVNVRNTKPLFQIEITEDGLRQSRQAINLDELQGK